MLGNLMYQTQPPTETLVYVSGLSQPRVAELREHFPHTTITRVPNRQDWGHNKRRRGTQDAHCDYLGYFNDDDTYHPTYIQRMLETVVKHRADVAYCNWNENPHHTRFHLYSSTAGNFIVRRDLAQAIGYPDDGYYIADGHFIDRLADNAKVIKLDELLYWHNQTGNPT